MRWKIATAVLLVVAFYLLVLAIQSKKRADAAEKIIEGYVVPELRDKGFDDGVFIGPKISDAPPGTKPILTAKGTVHYPAVVPAPVEPAVLEAELVAVPVPPVPAVTIPNCDLNDLDVTINCALDALVTPAKPWARLVTSGTISAWGQTRDLPPTPAGKVNLDVSPSVVAPRWHADILTGVAAGSRFGLELGASWTGKSRLGPYFLVEWQPATSGTAFDSYNDSLVSTGDPATWRIHAGMRIRIK